MLRSVPEPAAAYLPRALSAAWADEREIAFLLDVRGPGTGSLVTAGEVELLGPLGTGFDLRPGASLLVGGGIGAAILPWLVRLLDPAPRVVLGFRSERHAVCAALVDPEATVVLDPVFVTEPLARLMPFAGTVYACGPDPMLHAVAALCAEHDVPCQLAMEAAMACGFGACYGCAVRIDGGGSGCGRGAGAGRRAGDGRCLTCGRRSAASSSTCRWSTAAARWTRWSRAPWAWGRS